jgi:hypothetical protein
MKASTKPIPTPDTPSTNRVSLRLIEWAIKDIENDRTDREALNEAFWRIQPASKNRPGAGRGQCGKPGKINGLGMPACAGMTVY